MILSAFWPLHCENIHEFIQTARSGVDYMRHFAAKQTVDMENPFLVLCIKTSVVFCDPIWDEYGFRCIQKAVKLCVAKYIRRCFLPEHC